MNSPNSMGRGLRSAIRERDQGLSSCHYKTYRLLTIPSVKYQEKIDGFTSRNRVTSSQDGSLCLYETYIWDSWNCNLFKLKYLLSLFNSEALKRQSCVICSLRVLIYDWRSDGKLSDGLLSPYFVYIDLLVGGRCNCGGNFFRLGFTDTAHTISSD